MSITPQDPRALVLGVSQSPELPLHLRILKQRRVLHQDLELVARVIGESHWITLLRAGQPLLHEVLACVDLPAGRWSIYQPFLDTAACEHAQNGYVVRVAFQPLSGAIARLGTQSDYLQVEFPNPLGQAELPFTRIWWRLDPGGLSWWTTHVYSLPAGPVAVLSQSRYERSNEPWGLCY